LFTPHTYPAALLLMMLSMLCWGSWANTQKIGATWRFEPFYPLVASYVPMIGPATSFAMGEGNTMISALWGVFVWKEFKGATPRVQGLLGLMFLFFLLGLTSIALAPIVK
jgi:glucose uptake protein